MVRKVYAEDYLSNYLFSLDRPDGYTIGLILGQSTEQEDFVFHLAKTPPPAIEDVVEDKITNNSVDVDEKNKHIKSIHIIPESWVADHAKHVTRMLPGGTNVLGIFLVGPNDAFAENANVQKLRSVLSAIYRNLEVHEYLYGNGVNEHLVLCCNSFTKKYVCKSIDVKGSGIFKPADWKFQKKATKWFELQTVIDLDRLFLIPMNDDEPRPLRNQLEEILKDVAKMINSGLVVINDYMPNPDEKLESLSKLRKDNKDCKNEDTNERKPFHVDLYIPSNINEDSIGVQMTSCSASMRLLGQIYSRTFVHQKSTASQVTKSVKEDIIRSLASRLQMHWDSLIEEENGSPEDNVTYHEPPRRVLVELQESKVTLSDYLFPGEGAQEALMSLQELLDLRVLECNVQKDLEFQVDAPDFYNQSEINVCSANRIKSVVEECGFMPYVLIIGTAFIILIVAILIRQFFI